MMTQCNQQSFGFHPVGRREVVAKFDGGRITSDGGGLLLRETERLTGIIRQFATCFTDCRNPGRIEHSVEELLAQRVYALALGYEDLNDHDGGRKGDAPRFDRWFRLDHAAVHVPTSPRAPRAPDAFGPFHQIIL